MKAKDMQTVSTLRYLLSKIKNQQIELRAKGEEVTEEGVQRIIKKLIKQRKEAIEGYTKVGNTEMPRQLPNCSSMQTYRQKRPQDCRSRRFLYCPWILSLYRIEIAVRNILIL